MVIGGENWLSVWAHAPVAEKAQESLGETSPRVVIQGVYIFQRANSFMTNSKVCSERELEEGSLKSFKVNGRDVVVARSNGKLYAFERWCTHEQGDMAGGVLEGAVATCPDHGSQFDLGRNGLNVAGPDGDAPGTVPDLAVFKVSVIGGDVYVDI